MSRRLDTGGNIHDEPSKPSSHSSEKPPATDDAPTGANRQQEEQSSQGDATPPPRSGAAGNAYERKTVPKPEPGHGSHRPEQNQSGAPEQKRTQIYRPNTPAPEPVQPAQDPVGTSPQVAQTQEMEDPPVGWLVVVDGPGRGNVLTIGNGVNSLGRDASERLQLDFGDPMISRKNHAAVTYDPRGRKFYIQQGSGTNLIYIKSEPVLKVEELQPHVDIAIGNTMLRFVPLCGKQFNWEDNSIDSTD